ncbi:MAG: hypothetical protein AAB523_01840 [Patescibacteria group bacterium]
MNFLKTFFTTLGVIFFLTLLTGAYLYIADPFELKPLIKTLIGQPTKQVSDTKVESGTTDKNTLLSPEQEKAAEALGIDPAVLPSKITPAMEQCFYEKLGTQRANEIKAGAEPTATDYFKARACL